MLSSAQYETLLTDTQNGTTLIRLNRPKANAIIKKTKEELIKAFTRAESDDEVKVVVLSGEGKFFTAGLDLTSIPEHGPVLPDENIELLR